MTTEVIYATKTGHSKKIATAIAKELGCTVKNITEGQPLSQVDTLFIVGGIYGSQSLPELLSYVKNLSSKLVKKVVLITSSAGGVMKQEEVRNIVKQQGILVEEEEYTCKGNFLFVGWGHPNQDEIQKAVVFAKAKIIA